MRHPGVSTKFSIAWKRGSSAGLQRVVDHLVAHCQGCPNLQQQRAQQQNLLVIQASFRIAAYPVRDYVAA